MARPVIVWFRRDLRLADNAALCAAAADGRPVIPLFVLDETPGLRPPGGAGRWWLDKSLRALAADLEARGSRLVLRRGVGAEVVAALATETGAEVVWNRLYDPPTVARDTALKADLDARSFGGALLTEPTSVRTGAGGPYRQFTAFWRAVRSGIEPPERLTPPTLAEPERWPASDRLDEWTLHPRAPDWSTGFADWRPGEVGAEEQLQAFADEALADYATARDRPDRRGVSRLSPHLHWGEVSPGRVWRAIQSAGERTHAEGAADAFLRELGWREFNHHLAFHHPDLANTNYDPRFDRFPWRQDAAGLAAWRAGRTGYPLVDAGMRELWATGFMHNRVRMVAASFLIKHLLVDWREGERWFWDTLLDADEANNAANWQWVAGSGADAAPFFRIFNPTAQGERFDPEGAYVRRWVPELAALPPKLIHRPWEGGGVEGYPPPIVDHGVARQQALAAFRGLRG